MKKLAVIVLSLSLLIQAQIAFAAPPAPDIYSKSIIIASSTNSQILYQSNAEERIVPGALNHLLTAIIALEKGDADQLVTVSEGLTAVTTIENSLAGIKVGEQLYMKDLVTAMIVGNSDDAANAIALYISDNNMQEFVELMNSRAQALGTTNSNFVHPTGDYSENQYTTATDMFKIALKAYSMPTLKNALQSKVATLPKTEFANARSWHTNNYLFDNYLQPKYFYSNVTGGKTGYRSSTTCNAIIFGKKDNVELVVVVMGGQKIADEIKSLTDAKTALQWGFDNYSLQEFVKYEEIIGNSKLFGAKGNNSVQLIADDNIDVLVEKNSAIQPEKQITTLEKSFSAPISKGTKLGELAVSYNGSKIANIDLVAGNDYKANFISGFFIWLFTSWFTRTIFGIALVVYLYNLLVILPKKRKEKKRIERKRLSEERRRERESNL